jgi:hypothetical protein
VAPGIRVYRFLNEAIKDGFQVYDRTESGYLVRRRNADRWELALVELHVDAAPPRRLH